MTDFHCLSVFQMEYLINKFNVDTSICSFNWVLLDKEDDVWCLYTSPIKIKSYNVKVVPTFTLEDILLLFPNYRISTCTGGVAVLVETKDKELIKVISKTPLDAAYQMLCRLLRGKLI